VNGSLKSLENLLLLFPTLSVQLLALAFNKFFGHFLKVFSEWHPSSALV
jgi:hypothetical protein